MEYVAFLRGINVCKNKLIPMAELKDLFLDIGFTNPKTYLRSGNVVFEYNNRNNRKNTNNITNITTKNNINNNENNYNNDLSNEVFEIENTISENIKKVFGFDVVVIVKTKDEINFLIENNPYKDVNPIEELYFTIFKNKINKTLSKKLINESKKIDTNDKFTIAEKEIFILTKSKYHKTKFNNNYFESKLDNIATTRNWKTISKIKNMLE